MFAEISKTMAQFKGYRSLIAYQKSFAMGLAIFKLTKKFPKEEQYGLTSQIRRSSRSVGANLVEGYRKRMYPQMFVSKLNTSDGECSETLYWLEVALACEYITQEEFGKYELILDEVGNLLGSMIKSPEKFAPRGANTNSTNK
jgi:four helix bundle protein